MKLQCISRRLVILDDLYCTKILALDLALISLECAVSSLGANNSSSKRCQSNGLATEHVLHLKVCQSSPQEEIQISLVK